MKEKIKLVFDGMIVPMILYVGITFVVSFVYTLTLAMLGRLDLNDLSNINAFFLQGIASIVILGVFIPLYMGFKKTYDIKTSELNLRKALYVIPLAFGVCIVGNIILMYMPIPDDNGVTKQVFEVADKYGIGVSLFMVAVLIPAVEEFIFRGFMYDTAFLLKGHIFAIVFTSILFGVIHFNITQGIYAVFAGAFLGYVRYKFGSVSYNMLMHLIMNACSIMFMPAISLLTGIRDKIFIVLICSVLIAMSIYKINEYGEKNNSEEII